MGDTVNGEGVQKKSFFRGLKTEFKKIIWPTREIVIKHTCAVLSAAVALGIVIAILDTIIKYGLTTIFDLIK